MSKNVIEVSNLQKEFTKIIKEPGLHGTLKSFIKPNKQIFEAVKPLSFNVPKGQILGLIGTNGAGKSTIIKMLSGILTPSSGECLINNKIPTTNRAEYVKEIGVVFGQRTQLWWDLPVSETYSILKEIYDIPTNLFNKRLTFLDEVLELNNFINDPVRTLSLGQRMRADIAASMLHNPKVLFLDEPTIGLDVSVKDNIRKAIKFINKEEQTTIILTTHDISDIENLCDRILMIDKGESIFDGSLSSLKEQYGGVNTLNFTLNHNQDVSNLKIERLQDVEIIKSDMDLTLKYDSYHYQTPDLIMEVLNEVSIKDISMQECSIEEIIKRFYKKEISLD
ncbi:TPA: ATP-binding cassette domain-containing protein [Streptococcus mutans]